MSRLPLASLEQVMAGLMLSTGSLALLTWIMRQPDALTAHYGRICGHAMTQPHCPICYAATAAALLGSLATAAAFNRAPALIHLRR